MWRTRSPSVRLVPVADTAVPAATASTGTTIRRLRIVVGQVAGDSPVLASGSAILDDEQNMADRDQDDE